MALEKSGELLENPPMTKTCTTCGQEKPLSDFYKRCGGTKPVPSCKPCMAEYRKTPLRKARLAELSRSYYHQNREAVREQKTRYRSSILGRSLQLHDNARTRAAKLGVPFALTREWIAERLSGVCALTGRPFDMTRHKGGVRANLNAPSLDRVDSSKGYTMDNVRLVVVHANVARNEFTDADLLALAYDVIRTISSQAPATGEGSTTIPQGSRGQAAPKRPTPQWGDDIVSPMQ
jgi:hypothetical protein